MESFGLLIVALGVALANLPAAMQQWRADRAGFTKTIELLAVYLVYCLLGGGLILWLASRAHRARRAPARPWRSPASYSAGSSMARSL